MPAASIRVQFGNMLCSGIGSGSHPEPQRRAAQVRTADRKKYGNRDREAAAWALHTDMRNQAGHDSDVRGHSLTVCRVLVICIRATFLSSGRPSRS